MKIAIVGAGLAGLVVAEKLRTSGAHLASIDIFEKSRGLGGRIATRYHEHFVFDHGAPFFTARSELFRQWLAPMVSSGLIAEWNPKVVSLEKGKKSFKRPWFESHYVVSGKMSRLGKALTREHDGQIFQQQKVVSLARDDRGYWFLEIEHGEEQAPEKTAEKTGPYDLVILAIPGPQAKDLLGQGSSKLSAIPRSAEWVGLETFSEHEFLERHQIVVDPMAPEYTLMLGFTDLNLESKSVHWQLAKVANSSLSWISIENSKPGRDDQAYKPGKTSHCKSIILRSTAEWAKQNLDRSPAYVETSLVNELSELIGFSAPQPDFSRLHRWMFAQSSSDYLEYKKNANIAGDLSSPGSNIGNSVYDSQLGLAACGDWLMAGDVESAFLSAESLVDKIVRHIN